MAAFEHIEIGAPHQRSVGEHPEVFAARAGGWI
jgi:hypothetical protein